MKKQYQALVKFKDYPNDWMNASVMVNGSKKRYLSTKEEAEEVIKKVLNIYNKNQVGFTINGIVISYEDLETISNHSIIETRIRWREVTDWEEC